MRVLTPARAAHALLSATRARWSAAQLAGLLVCLSAAGCATYTPAALPSRPALANGLPPGRGSLSVADVEQLAVAHDPDLLAAAAQRPVVQAELLQASLLPNPTVTGAALPLAAGAAGAVTGTGPAGSSTLAWNAGFTYDLRALITRSSRRRAAAAQAQALDASLLWQAWQTIAQARLLCVQVIEGERLLGLLRAQRDLLAERSAASQRALARGDATLATAAPDVTAVQTARGAVYEQERVALARRHQLDALLGLSPNAVLLLDSPPVLPAIDPAAIRAGLDSLPQRRPDLAALRLGYAAKEQSLRSAVLAQFPNIVFGVTGGSDNANIRNVGPQLSVELPIFDRNQGQIAIERASRAQLAAEYAARLAATEGQVGAMLRETALLEEQLTQARRDLPALRRDAVAAQTALAAANLDERSALDLITARLAKEQQIVTLEQAVLEARVALATLTGAGLPPMRILPEARA